MRGRLNQIQEIKTDQDDLATIVNRLENEVAALRMELQAVEQRSASRDAAIGVRADGADDDLERALLRQRLLFEPHAGPVPDLAPAPGHKTLDQAMAALEADAPRAFAQWRKLVDVNADAYDGCPVDSCSVEGHPRAEDFRCFLRPYLTGAVLDIGCGPQDVPSYLRDHPTTHLAGLDPLPPTGDHPFTFVPAVAEHLPWPDATFDTVVIATSLDHVLLLDRAIDEVARVLRPEGRLLIWVSFIPGSPVYQPRAADVAPVDAYHLFHFDRPWFEAAFAAQFAIREAMHLRAGDSSFYAFTPRDDTGHQGQR